MATGWRRRWDPCSTRLLRFGLGLLGVAVTLGGSLLLVLATSPSSASASTLGGTATLVDQTVDGTGASTDLFTVQLPSGAACTGDTASDGYHVYSYLIPEDSMSQAAFATTLNYTGPPAGEPSQGLGLVEQSNGDVWEGKSTAPITAEVIDIPADFQWAQLVTQQYYPLTGSNGLLYDGASGVWETGIACANSSGVISDYWNTEVTFAASTSDTNGFTWTAVPGLGTWGGSSTPTTTTTSSTTTTTTTAAASSSTVAASPTASGSQATGTGSTGSARAGSSADAASPPGLESISTAPSEASAPDGAGSEASPTASAPSSSTGSSPTEAKEEAGGSGPQLLATGAPIHVGVALVIVLLGLAMCVVGLLAHVGAGRDKTAASL